ncbi:MAG: hypothetical protein A2Y38_19335 [Spirochaetes bacterium GWB1_59_5]|nr:MAG: hypothetical protein A2Y38_19335 [Spirochaetes bacterium GWB1_59_5]
MKNWISFMQTSIGDEEQIEQLGKWIAALLNDASVSLLLHLVSPGPSGKTVLTQLLVRMVGESKVSRGIPSVNDPAASVVLKGKRLIVLEELEATLKCEPDAEEPEAVRSGAVSDLIHLLSGGNILVREKFEKEEVLKPNLAIVATSNHAPLDGTAHVWSRMLQINMRVPPSRNPALFQLLVGEIDEIKAWALAL